MNQSSTTTNSSSSSSSSSNINSIHILAHHLPINDETFDSRLKECAEHFFNAGHSQPAVLSSLNSSIVEAVVSATHIALLLDDGRICRLSYTIGDHQLAHQASTSADINQATKSKSARISSASNSMSAAAAAAAAAMAAAAVTVSTTSATTSSATTSSSSAAPFRPQSRSGFRSHDAFIIPGASDILAPISSSFGRGRRGNLLRGRYPGGLIMGQRIPSMVRGAGDVPESLIESVQTVLQSKSRNVIIRELMRTNLDVNLAVNNLLQRDDEGEDAGDDDDAYIHSGDLISLLDINAHGEHGNVIIDSDGVFDEDTLRITRRLGRSLGAAASANPPAANASESNASDRDRSRAYRLREQRWIDTARDEIFAGRSLEREHSHTSSRGDDATNSARKSTTATNANTSTLSTLPVSFGKQLQFWTEKNGDTPQFVKIASMYSELIAVSKSGHLYQWRWSSEHPYTDGSNHHPKATQLNLTSERIIGVSSSLIRATAWTESGRVATWLDESIDIPSTLKLQSPCQQLIEPSSGDSIAQISVSNWYTVARLTSGAIYWWGLMPYKQRAKLIEKFQCKALKLKSQSNGNDITVGTHVCLKTLPLYHMGTIAISVRDGVPKIGQMSEHMFSYKDTKPLKFKSRSADSFNQAPHEMPPPPSPSNDPTPPSSSNNLKRKKPTSEDTLENQSDESWNLSDLIYIEDTKGFVLGKVIKIDADYVIVKMSKSTNNTSNSDTTESNESLLENCRIFQKSQLQAIKSSSSIKLPDFIQRQPKRLADFGGQVLTLTAHHTGINALIYKENSLHQIHYDIISNKPTKERKINVFSPAFVSQSLASIRLITNDDPSVSCSTLFDGNSTPYPLIDINGATKEPIWKNLQPMRLFTQTLTPRRTLITLFTQRTDTLTTSILRYDTEKLLQALENCKKNAAKIASERIDGNRNILHACVFAATPISNDCASTTARWGTKFAKTLTETTSDQTPPLQSDHNYNQAEINSDETQVYPPVRLDEREKRQSAIKNLQIVLESPVVKEHLGELLCGRNSDGMTPFMYAVASRAYHAALLIFDAAKLQASEFSRAIYPPDAPVDNSPLYVLCCNDTCSFTWTGDNHITQDIYECRTCSLVGNLCCCSECARTCHKGHDCKIKTSSPTAYCDCWEKCKCKALLAGDAEKRFELFTRLITDTSLLSLPNSRGEHLIMYLTQTLGRQSHEQRNYKRNVNPMLRKNLTAIESGEMPQHDLEPPKFARQALAHLLSSWQAVAHMIDFGCQSRSVAMTREELFDESAYLDCQSSCVDLDKFTYTLLTKCPSDMLNTLVDTMSKELNENGTEVSLRLAKRFMRSLVRIYVIVCMENQASSSSSSVSSSHSSASGSGAPGVSYSNSIMSKLRKSTHSTSGSLHSVQSKCENVFKSLASIAVIELANSAQSIISPVLVGIPRAVTTPQAHHHHEKASSSLTDELFTSQAVNSSRNPPPNTSNASLPLFQAPPPPPSFIRRLYQSATTTRQPSTSSTTSNNNNATSANDMDQQSELSETEASSAELNTFDLNEPEEMDLNLFVESDSDSDANSANSQKDSASAAQRSVVGTAAGTVGTGSDPGTTGAYFSEDESADDVDSSNEDDDDDEEEDEDDDHEADESSSELLNVETAASAASTEHSNAIAVDLIPNSSDQSSNDAAYATTNNASNNNNNNNNNSSSNATRSNIQWSIRRHASDALSRIQASSTAPPPSSASNTLRSEAESLQQTNFALARSFALIVRTIRQLLNTLHDKNTDSLPGCASFQSLQEFVNSRLEPTWRWMSQVLDSNESQLRFGCAFTASNGESTYLKTIEETALANNPSNKRRKTTTGSSSLRINSPPSQPDSTVGSHRKDFLNYALSLMRMSSGEHKESLPTVDINSLKHIACIFDAIMFYLSVAPLEASTEVVSSVESPLILLPHLYETDEATESSETEMMDTSAVVQPQQSAESSDDEESSCAARAHSFFSRSESTLCLGAVAPDPFALPLDEAIPLAAKPHLLQPNARKQDMFKVNTNKYEQFLSLSKMGLCESERAIPRLSLPKFKRKREGESEGETLFDRWRLTLDLFGRVFCDELGSEAGSVLRQLGGFPVRESRFRREMEKYRNSATKELSVEVERDRDAFLVSSMKALNTMHAKRQQSSTVSSLPPLCISRLKATFRDEQGEGSGVARSFFTAFAENVLSNEKLPVLMESSVSASTSPQMINVASMLMGSGSKYRSAASSSYARRGRSKSSDRRLSVHAAPFYSRVTASASADADFTLYDSLSTQSREIAERLLVKVSQWQPVSANKIVGMLMELRAATLPGLLASDAALRMRVDEAMMMLGLAAGDLSLSGSGEVGAVPPVTVPVEVESDNAPLFWMPDKRLGTYAPRAGKNSPGRLNAFRNVGRIVGICLLQNELCPLPLSRHVIKYVLGRPVKWHDLAFFDPAMYESFRKMIVEAEKPAGDLAVKCMELTFSVDLPKDEDGGTFELIANGSKVEVTKANVYEYVKLYAEFRMVKRVEQACASIRQGIFDVLPANALNGLNSEDFRLLLNGIVDINVGTLMGYTSVCDESKEPTKRAQFEKWFWGAVEKMSAHEKHELLFFWTGSPYLPASKEGFQPPPSITLRPPSDQHLPTANTCINRLYVPMYSTKNILKSKLLYAIKTKLFGFV